MVSTILTIGIVLFVPLLIRGALAESGSDISTQISLIQAQLTSLSSQTRKLEIEIQSKNDQTQLLQVDVQTLNQSLLNEQQRTRDLEARVTALESKLKNTETSVGEIRADLQQTTAIARTLQNELLATRYETEQVNETLTNKITELFKTLNSTFTKNTGRGVFFTFRNLEIPSSYTFTNSSPPLRFTGLISNVGNGYSPTSGQFTAPISGMYWFSVTLAVNTKAHVACCIILKGNEYLVEVFASQYTVYSSAGTSVLVHLDKGDTTDVSKCTGLGTLSSYKSSFSGFLVQPD